MISVLHSFLLTLRTLTRSRAALQLEILALRHQLAVLQRSGPRRRPLKKTARCLWVLLSRLWTGWRTALVIVKPETIIAWHRRGFQLWWIWKSRRRLGRPTVPANIRTLIREMAEANPRWGAPRMHGELLKLGIDVCQSTVAKIHGLSTPAALADMANVPEQSRRPDRRRRFVRGSDCHVPPRVRAGAARSRSAPHPGTWRSPRIRRRPGRHSRCAKRFRGTRRRGI